MSSVATWSAVASATCSDTCPSAHKVSLSGSHKHRCLPAQLYQIWQCTGKHSTGWTVRRSNPGGGHIFRIHPHRPCGPPNLLYSGYRVFPVGKAIGVWRWPPTPSSAQVKEKVELYFYSPSGPSRPVIGWTLSLPLQASTNVLCGEETDSLIRHIFCRNLLLMPTRSMFAGILPLSAQSVGPFTTSSPNNRWYPTFRLTTASPTQTTKLSGSTSFLILSLSLLPYKKDLTQNLRNVKKNTQRR